MRPLKGSNESKEHESKVVGLVNRSSVCKFIPFHTVIESVAS